MDGDQMGKTLSSFKNIDDHRNFSEQLGAFANSVKKDIPEDGLLIYAGGDDVLAVVKATDAINVANKLQNKFKTEVGNNASAGIAIGHSSVPLQDLVHAAHAAESRAKKTYGRNALSISIYKRSGEILEWGCKWESKALDVYGELSTLSALNKEKQINIGRFPYKLAALLQPYALKGKVDEQMQAIVMAEYDHAVEQTKDMRDEHKHERLTRDYVAAYLEACCKDTKEVSAKPEDFLNLFMAETFINRPREGEDD
jgi:CRISPR/Cas system-associated protein Cas10 (large subunit of type III CRISPR-Cas system)